MPSQFEFQYRWAEIAQKGLENSIDELEARDQAIEQFILGFECSSGESAPELIQFFGAFDGLSDAGEYTFSTSCNLTELFFSGFTLAVPTFDSVVVDFDFFIDGGLFYSATYTSPTDPPLTIPLLHPVSAGSTLKVQCTTDHAFIDAIFYVSTDGVDDAVVVGWDA